MQEASKNLLESEIQRLRSAVRELSVLNELAIAASTSNDVEAMLATITEKSVRAVEAEQGSIQLLTQQESAPLKTLVREQNLSKTSTGYRIGDHITGWVLVHQKPLKVDDLATDNRFNASSEEKAQIRSLLCLPIRFKNQMLGLLVVINKKTEKAFSAGDMRLLSIIAAQSGQLIHNTQLQEQAFEQERLARELALARDIQQNLLPVNPPQIAGVDIATFFKAADEVSGDYFDFFELPGNKMGIVIADVSGHGMPSALMMTMVKGILHTTATQHTSASDIVSTCNKIITPLLTAEMFVTMLFMVLDPASRQMDIALAGHHPVMVFKPGSGRAAFAGKNGPALGLLPKPKYVSSTHQAESGDVLVLYTDGMTEAFSSQGEMFETEDLERAIAAVSSKSAGQIQVSVVEAVDAFTGEAPQSDDMAMIVLKFL